MSPVCGIFEKAEGTNRARDLTYHENHLPSAPTHCSSSTDLLLLQILALYSSSAPPYTHNLLIDLLCLLLPLWGGAADRLPAAAGRCRTAVVYTCTAVVYTCTAVVYTFSAVVYTFTAVQCTMYIHVLLYTHAL